MSILERAIRARDDTAKRSEPVSVDAAVAELERDTVVLDIRAVRELYIEATIAVADYAPRKCSSFCPTRRRCVTAVTSTP